SLRNDAVVGLCHCERFCKKCVAIHNVAYFGFQICLRNYRLFRRFTPCNDRESTAIAVIILHKFLLKYHL
ncbi:hypothetical protein, partial [Helicobacter rodentium]|uniref:hypothetical protein n=1 Tax=Helicobacter rodentium TaxID=59617 RepID=UPI00263195C8